MHAHRRPLEQLELVHAAIERLEQSIAIQDANCTSHAGDQSCEYPFIIIDQVIALKGLIYSVATSSVRQWY